MINFDVKQNNLSEGFETYIHMYQKVKGSVKGALRLETFRKRIRIGRIVLPNAIFQLEEANQSQSKVA